ncbi:MAG: tRNA (guanine(10)-N(2))-dimethyltransferase [Nitrososphaeraceae archaeon]|nr:tRNA (guanine(10)-N(2))-dimethyltransferase [Nitrososphaeraceae archaeon]MDW0184952.1 tRNA (guanine(10)-N(2))-dimethyltransferase [Nitrososphaeraceae archaeon]MDW0199114.1 tRNA (guanine(10)-N(2))-dimethyltransferase [Nitrososphaeraceae archaeon]MDW0211784.1 tRNA (guanine(10)-N(2))-dimethyltransferase [Nitrososphaeraceae archaeon]MDW0219617.1 tRNA (guanine(10)-N(2))-dimethyltransferase [Nitrososphaeraceae archaeon]
MNHDVSEIKEGKTSLLVPSSALSQSVPPKNPAFFNPNAKWNRDISMLVYKVYTSSSKNKTLADSICGVGARGLRASVEVPQIETIYFNDLNPIAIEFAKESAKLNQVQYKCIFKTNEVCKFLNFEEREIRRFDIVDLDPFGSPSPYVDCVLRSVSNGGLISITATDTAVLCGVYPSVCYRKYYGFPIRSEYSNEIGVRLLVSFIALNATRFDLSVVPYFCHSNLHYLRVYLKIIFSSSLANTVSSKIGFIKHCQKCKSRRVEKIREPNLVCDLCGAKCIMAGPLWIDSIFDSDFVNSMLNELKNSENRTSPRNDHNRLLKMMQICTSELPIPAYFETDSIASSAKKSSISLDKVISTLASNGFQSSKTTMNEKGFKTDASPKEIIELLYK